MLQWPRRTLCVQCTLKVDLVTCLDTTQMLCDGYARPQCPRKSMPELTSMYALGAVPEFTV